jgi:hypothetical protein
MFDVDEIFAPASCNIEESWLMVWTAPYGISVPE